MIKNHGKVMVSFILLVAVCGIWIYLATKNAEPVTTAAAPPPPPEVQIKITELPKEEKKEEQKKEKKKEAEKPKTEQVKTIKASEKSEAEANKAAPYKAEKNNIGAGFGGDDKGFPSFWCENPEEGRAFLASLWKLGIREFIVLSDGKMAGVVPFDNRRVHSLEKRHPQTTSGFQRVLTGDDIALLGLTKILAAAGSDIQRVKVGFYLPEQVVLKSLADYTRKRNIGPREIESFSCRYSEEGFSIIEVQRRSREAQPFGGKNKLAALPQ